MNEMLHPRKVCISSGRNSEFPSYVIPQEFPFPVAVIKRRIRKDKIRFQLLMCVIQETSFVVPLDIRINTPNGKVHLAQAPGGLVGFLSINSDISYSSFVSFYEFLTLHEHPA